MVIAGTYRMRLGPVRARFMNHLGTGRALLAQESPSVKELRILREKLERTLQTLDKLCTEWANNVEDQPTEDKPAHEDAYKSMAEGPGGFLTLIEEGTEILSELSGTLETKIHQMNLDASILPPPPPPPLPNTQTSTVRLPARQLPVFTGKLTEWPTFWSIIESTIDSNSAYSDAEKFGYLLITLSPRIQDEIKGYQLTNGGYQLAKTYLKSRYGNVTFIKRALYREIKDLQIARKVSEVRENWITLNRVLLQLEKLGEDISSPAILQDLEQKFNEWVLREVVSEQIKHTGDWTPRTFLASVDQIANIREITMGMTNFSAEERRRPFPRQTVFAQNTEKSNFQRKDVESSRIGTRRPCVFCSSTEHTTANCPKYTTKDQRVRRLTELKKCLRCFADGHFSKDCRSKISCKQCNGTHYFAICSERDKKTLIRKEQTNAIHDKSDDIGIPQSEISAESIEIDTEPSDFVNEEDSYGITDHTVFEFEEPPADYFGIIRCRNNANQIENVSAIDNPVKSKTILATKNATFLTNNKGTEIGLIFLDSGATCSFISERFAEKLGFWNTKTNHEGTMEVRGYGGRTSKFGSSVIKIGVQQRNGNIRALYLNTSPNLEKMRVHYALNQRDFRFEEKAIIHIRERQPDILIGLVDMMAMIDRIEKLSGNRFVLWTDIGPIMCGRPKRIDGGKISDVESQYTLVAKDDKTDGRQNEDYWSLETVGIRERELQLTDDEEAWGQFNQTIIRLPDGRYEVGWPWRKTNNAISDNFGIAIGRLRSTLKKWQKEKPNVLEAYDKTIQEQKDLDIIEVAPSKTQYLISYLPHQAVLKETSSFTKIRVVYDASAGRSPLNRELLRGAVLLPQIPGILIRLRLPKYVVCCDIAKAFLQLSLRESDRDVTRFIWVKDLKGQTEGNNIIVYRFKRVPFGVISSPFLLIATILYHLENYGEPKEFCKEIKANLYMDNILFGASSTEEIMQKHHQIKETFSPAKMNIREFGTNDAEANKLFSIEDKHPGIEKDQIKLLGINWTLSRDVWEIPLPSGKIGEKVTKREVLSIIHRIFDPCGLVNPVLLSAKTLYQNLCERKANWNDELTDKESDKLKAILKGWNGKSFKIQRKIQQADNPDSIQLHCFTDSSSIAYAAAVYIRISKDNTSTSHLIFAKNRIVPLNKCKTLTIPRLELLAILIGTRALKFTKNEIQIKIDGFHLWSDSQIALSWIKNGKEKQTFIQNRVNEIIQNKWIEFHYLSTEDNPADIGTREISGQELEASSLWWNGPHWLKNETCHWPSEINFIPSETEICCVAKEDEIEEKIPTHHINPERFSRWWRLVRTTMVYMRALFKFCEKIKRIPAVLQHAQKLSRAGHFTANDYQIATRELIRQAQERKPPAEALVRTYDIFPDQTGIFRCQSRLQNIENYDFANPIFLPNKDPLTALIISRIHLVGLHNKTNSVISELRQNFFIPKMRQTVKRSLRNCLGRCQSRRPYGRPIMPPLPKSRITRSIIFTHTALDYMGPFQIKTTEESTKRWILMLTCLCTRLIHMEIVSDMTTNSFLNAFRKFVARRTRPSTIVSDNGAQFHLASKTLHKIVSTIVTDTQVISYFSKEGINWHFSTPLAPWENGIVERVNGLAKTCFHRAIGRRHLTEDDFQTLVCETEAILNCRPLIPIQDDLNTIVLRPIDFIYPFATPAFPPMEGEDKPWLPRDAEPAEKLTVWWQTKQETINKFWNLWSTDYLSLLRERTAKHKDAKNSLNGTPKIGEIVQVHDEGMLKGCWRLGKVTEIKSPRAIIILLGDGTTITRPISHIYSLEIPIREAPKSENPEECSFMDSIFLLGRKVARSARNSNQSLLFIMTFLSLICGMVAQSPMLCPSTSVGTIWRISEKFSPCTNFTADPPLPSTHRFNLYRPNIDLVTIESAHCSIIKKTISFKTDLLNNDHKYVFLQNETISKEECLRMWKLSLCRYGKLYGDSNTFRTNNGPDFEYSYWQWGYSNVSASNCYLTTSKIYIQPGTKALSSPLGSINHCKYQDEACMMEDESILTWRIEVKEQNRLCNFIEFADWKGVFMGNIWTAENQEFAISFGEKPEILKDCQRQLVISSQGYAVPQIQYHLLNIKKLRRTKRTHTGQVMSNQLAAELTATQVLSTKAVKEVFTHLSTQICLKRNSLGRKDGHSSGYDTTEYARSLMNSTYLQAKWITKNIIEVRNCLPIPFKNISFTASKICYHRIPINVTILDKRLGAFLDPHTLIITEKATNGSCEYHQFTSLLIEGNLLRVDQIKGQYRAIKHEEIHELHLDPVGNIKPFKLEAHPFADFIITNYSDPRIEVLQMFQAYRLDKRFEEEKLSKEIGTDGEFQHQNFGEFGKFIPKPPPWIKAIFELKTLEVIDWICRIFVIGQIFNYLIVPLLIKYVLKHLPNEYMAYIVNLMRETEEQAFELQPEDQRIVQPMVPSRTNRRRRNRRGRNVT